MSSGDAWTVRHAIDLLCRWNATRELIIEEGARYTGERLNREARAMAQALQQAGIGRGDVVAFLGTSTCRFYAAFFAAQKLGCVTCNINMRETGAFIHDTLRGIDARAVICADSVCATVAEAVGRLPVRRPVFSLGDRRVPGADLAYGEALARHPADEPQARVSPDDPAIIILSSGSTGAPKGIVHSNANFVRWMRAAPALFGHVSRSTRLLVIVGTSFAAWPFSTVSVLYGGGSLVLVEGFTPESFCAAIEREKATMAGPVPTMIRMLDPAITSRYDLSSLRMILCAGEPPSPTDIERVRSWADTDIRCLYLASESAPGAATYWELRDQTLLGKPVCAGKPVPGTDLRVVDPEGGIDDVLPAGESGEILLRGPTIAMGYLNNAELTARRFVGGWWRSGDLGHLDADGFLYVSGRTDNTINSGGIKVQGEEVEICLIAHPGVAQVAVIGVRDPKWGQRIEAHVAVKGGTTEAELRDHCRERLASFKQPKTYVFHEQLPVGATGKLDRVALRRRYAAGDPRPGEST
ncbi:MAG: acyl--CoA ligase [Gammaproteobacteria bacterium]|nr:acyl--CoA ligase [Gammaproteobacteria bacterium]